MKPPRLPPLLYLGLMLAVAGALAAAVVWAGFPDSVMVLLVVPALMAALIYPRRFHLLPALVASAAIIWDNTTSNYLTVDVIADAAIASGLIFGVSEVLYRLAGDRARRAAALRQSEDRFALVYNASPVGITISVIDDGTLIDANDSFLQMMGYARDDLIGKSALELGLWANPADRAVMVEEVKRTGQSVGNVFKGVTRSGRHVEALMSSRKITLDGQDRLVNFILDITERQEADRRLRDSEERFKLVFDASPIGITINAIDESTFIDANDSFLQMMGYARDDLIGKSALELGLWANPADRAVMVEDIKRTGQLVGAATTGIAQTGQRVEMLLFSRKITLDGRERLLNFELDITERQQAEQRLRESEDLYRALFDQSPMGLGLADSDGNLLAFNDAMLAPGGYTRQDIERIGNVGALYFDAGERAQTLAEAQREGALNRREVRFKRKDGSPYVTLLSLRRVNYRGQECWQAMVEDITERKQAEETLKEAQRITHVGSWEVKLASLDDWNQNPQWWSDEVYRIFGHEPGAISLSFDRFIESVHPDDRKLVIAANEDAVLRDQPYDLIHRIVLPDGSERVVHEQAEVERDESGHPTRMIGTIQDITERERASAQIKELLAAERQARQMAEAMHAANAALTSSLDLDAILNMLLDYLETIVPYDSANIMIRDKDGLMSLTHLRGYERFTDAEQVRSLRINPADEAPLRRLFKLKSVLIPDVVTYDGWVTHPETAYIQSWMGVPLVSQGQLFGLFSIDKAEAGFFTTEHLRLAEALAAQASLAIKNAQLLRDSEERNRRLAILNEITRIGAQEPDLTTMLRKISETLAGFINSEETRVSLWDEARQLTIPITTSEQSHKRWPPRFAPGEKTLTLSALEAGKPLVIENLLDTPYVSPDLVRRSGNQAALALPLQVEGRKLGGLVISFRQPRTFSHDEVDWAAQAAELVALAIAKAQARSELEDRVAARTAELRAANDQLIELAKAKDEFVSNVSHELRTPITSIKLYHHLLEARPDQSAKYLTRLERETRRLETIIEDLLALSRLDQGRLALSALPFDLAVIAQQHVEDREALADSRGVSLTFERRRGERMAYCDPALIGQALSVILTNALNYTPPGGRVVIRAEPRRRHGQRWETLRVSDSGPGISAADMPRLFQRFFRGSVGAASGAPGTGLGLALAREIVARHGGTITVDSAGEPGQGAAFTLWLPAA